MFCLPAHFCAANQNVPDIHSSNCEYEDLVSLTLLVLLRHITYTDSARWMDRPLLAKRRVSVVSLYLLFAGIGGTSSIGYYESIKALS